MTRLPPEARAALEALGISRYGLVAVGELVFEAAFREACASNQCGRYGTNWACPPGVGAPDALAARARGFRCGLVLQTVWPIEDAFDFEGMLAAGERHNALFRKAVGQVAPLLAAGGATLALSAGACGVCPSCTYPEGAPCRFPERALASLEAYGIDVARLLEAAGLAYRNGADTVSYVGLLLF